jgi:hypothetical protein
MCLTGCSFVWSSCTAVQELIMAGHLPVLQASWTELNQLQLGIMLYKDRQFLSDVIAVCQGAL